MEKESKIPQNIDKYKEINPYELKTHKINKRGIYFLFKNDTIVYIGQSKCIFSRVNVHTKYKDFDCFSFIEIPDKTINLYELEKELIIKHLPVYNIVYIDKSVDRIIDLKEKRELKKIQKENENLKEVLKWDPFGKFDVINIKLNENS